ncbi:hypothetical protein NKJ06_14910 [Mesorhizobium sp. M0293]|uniref:hypothetical protein n=1 Tax=Mesorhizobium sp. M0293 TaxID=2956930 RepID=UPI003337F3A1
MSLTHIPRGEEGARIRIRARWAGQGLGVELTRGHQAIDTLDARYAVAQPHPLDELSGFVAGLG